MSTKINYTAEQGSTFAAVTTGVNESGGTFNLTNWDTKGQIRKDYTGSLVANLVTSVTGSAASGTILIELSATASAAIEAGTYTYDVEISSGSVVRRWQEGKLYFTPEVTTD